MEIRANRMDFCQTITEECGRKDRHVYDAVRRMPLSCRIVVLTLILSALTGPVFGQFTVQPMKVDFQITPGKLLPKEIIFRNTDTEQTIQIGLRLVDLSQGIDGTWMIIEPNDGFDTSKLRSLKEAINLSHNTMTLDPGQTFPVDVTIRVPRGVRGFYCAGILATLGDTLTDTQLPMNLRYLIPVVLQSVGTARAHRIKPVDVGMSFVPISARGLGTPSTVMLSMDIENTGETFPRCRPVARIWAWAGEHWRHVITTGFEDNASDIGIIPGAKVRVRTDLMKSLPRGKYKVAGLLYVDGRRSRRLEEIIDFKGDPDVQNLAVDTALDLSPREILVDCTPGGTRTTLLRVQSSSDATVNVQAYHGLPDYMGDKFISVYNVKGLEMDCSPWIKVEPERFTLSGEGGEQVIRITTSMPRDAVDLPNYYANIDFWSTYPDGQNAGRTRARLAVRNVRFDKFQVEPLVHPDRFTPYVTSGSKYLIAAKFINPGLIPYTPMKCKAALTFLTSDVPRVSAILRSSERGYLLPCEERQFTGILDLTTIDPGEYRLSVGLQYDENLEWVQMDSLVTVTLEGNRRVLHTTRTQHELESKFEIKWSKTLEKAIENNDRG